MTPITYNDFLKMLEILPPADSYQNYKAFLVGEPYDHNEQGQPRYHSFFAKPDKNEYYDGGYMTKKEFHQTCKTFYQ